MKPATKIIGFTILGAVLGVIVSIGWAIYLPLGGCDFETGLRFVTKRGLRILTTSIPFNLFIFTLIAAGIGALTSLLIFRINKIKNMLPRCLWLMLLGAFDGALLGSLIPIEVSISIAIIGGGGAGAVIGSLLFLEAGIVNRLTEKKSRIIGWLSLSAAIILGFIVAINLYLSLASLFCAIAVSIYPNI